MLRVREFPDSLSLTMRTWWPSRGMTAGREAQKPHCRSRRLGTARFPSIKASREIAVDEGAATQRWKGEAHGIFRQGRTTGIIASLRKPQRPKRVQNFSRVTGLTASAPLKCGPPGTEVEFFQNPVADAPQTEFIAEVG